MDPQRDHLAKVGREAFDMLDECLGRKRRPPPANAFYPTRPVPNPPTKKEPALGSTQVVREWVLVVPHRRRPFY
ncbi:hypothetical protein COCNU_16G003730 [Cocos nucifera]|uniref:Uncharacterized protein n=1 Tax=Cocos nucifera TaxID=13894 RepID=A0A8K0IYQ4_COCNU|nr:hypothetical protein COCNU_16G003730 [Cocos nucifera]